MLTEILTLMESGRLAEAEETALARVASVPTDAECWSLLTVLAAQRNDLSLAIERSDRALELVPDDVRAWLNRGNLERLRGDRSRAVGAYTRVLEIVPGHDAATFNLAALAEEDARWTEAETRYREILQRRPEHAETLYNLARLLASEPLLQEEEAVELYARATGAAPFHVDSWRNHAHLLRRLGRDEEAAASYRRVLELDPADETSRHLLAALEGRTPGSAERAYVIDLFDRFAPTYDRDYGERLGYEGAVRLAADVVEVAGGWDGSVGPVRLLDLGCGTGLFPSELRDQGALAPNVEFAATGVDLSSGMLAVAEENGHYERLAESDAIAWLRDCDEEFDLIVLADVLIYLGDPAPLLDSAEACLRPGGMLAFTVEREEGGDDGSAHCLRRSGRFAHRPDRVRALLVERGFEVQSWKEGPLRRERGEVVEGLYVVVRWTGVEGDTI